MPVFFLPESTGVKPYVNNGYRVRDGVTLLGKEKFKDETGSAGPNEKLIGGRYIAIDCWRNVHVGAYRSTLRFGVV